MTRKTYRRPTADSIALVNEGMIAASEYDEKVGVSETAHDGTQLTNRQGWDCGNWMPSDDE